MSVGAGLAIAGVWLAASALSIFIMLIMFVWSTPSTDEVSEISSYGIWIILLLIAAPLIAAYSVTKMIINNEAD